MQLIGKLSEGTCSYFQDQYIARKSLIVDCTLYSACAHTCTYVYMYVCIHVRKYMQPVGCDVT